MKAVHTQGGPHKRRSTTTARVLLFEGPQARLYTQKAVHPQGGARKRRYVATTGVLLFKIHGQGGKHGRQYTYKVVRTKGGL